MELKEWITLASVAMIVIGWFITSHLNRKQDISKRRTDFRLEALKSFLPIPLALQKNPNAFAQDPTLVSTLETARVNFQLYGLKDEISLMENFISAINTHNLQSVNETFPVLVSLIVANIRKELGFNRHWLLSCLLVVISRLRSSSCRRSGRLTSFVKKPRQ